jgi:hypothetical protein
VPFDFTIKTWPDLGWLTSGVPAAYPPRTYPLRRQMIRRIIRNRRGGRPLHRPCEKTEEEEQHGGVEEEDTVGEEGNAAHDGPHRPRRPDSNRRRRPRGSAAASTAAPVIVALLLLSTILMNMGRPVGIGAAAMTDPPAAATRAAAFAGPLRFVFAPPTSWRRRGVVPVAVRSPPRCPAGDNGRLAPLRRGKLLPSSLGVALASSPSGPSEDEPSPSKSKKSESKAALRHVLEEVCRFSKDSAFLRDFRRRSGGIASLEDLWNMSDEQVTDMVLMGAGSAGVRRGAAMTDRQRNEIRTFRMLRMWRADMQLELAGSYPTEEKWRELSAADFARFEAKIGRSAPAGAGASPTNDDDDESRDDPLQSAQVLATVPPPSLTGFADLDETRLRAQAFVESVMTQRPEPIAGTDGMSVMRDVQMLETGVSRNIVIRKVTRPFWQACIDTADTPGMRCRVCAVGTPGIGKTASTPYLIKMLLERKKTVVYRVREPQEAGWIYEFIPGSGDGDSVTANVYPEQAFKSGVPSLRLSSTYYVVDPGDTNDSCKPSSLFRPKVIIVASPDSKHWGGSSFSKERDDVHGRIKVFPVWELEELLQARPILRPEMTNDEVENRYYQVGGVPRHIFCDGESFDEALERQSGAMNDLTAEQLRRLANINVKSATTFDTSQPKSALIGFRVSDKDDGTFRRYAVDVIAPRVVASVFREFLKSLWQDLSLPSAANPWIFEAYTRYLLVTSSTFQCRKGVGKEDPVREITRPITLGGCKEIRSAWDIIAAAREREMVVFHPVNLAEKLIDFVYKDSAGHFHAFQATLAMKHSAKIRDILKLEELVGGPRHLSLYYLVPESHFSEFVTDPVDPRNPPPRKDDPSEKDPPPSPPPPPPRGGKSSRRKGPRKETLPSCTILHVSIQDPNSSGED